MDKHEVLRAAADYIAVNGHCKGTLYSFEGKALDEQASVCAMGAIREACGLNKQSWFYKEGDLFDQAAKHLGHYLRAAGELHAHHNTVRDPSFLIPEWNDALHRTAEDVILMMKRAAEEEL